MPLIVVDTNLIVRNPPLASEVWTSVSANMAGWNLKLLIPEIVFMEAVNVVSRGWRGHGQTVRSLKVAGLKKDLHSIATKIEEQAAGYEDFLRTRIGELGMSVYPLPSIDHLKLAARASNRQAPYSAGDRDGYRDTLIWLTVLDIAEQHPSEKVWFVSDNHADFGNPQGLSKDFPAALHPELETELREHGLEDRVRYVRTLEDLASLHSPINEQDFLTLEDQLEYGNLSDYLLIQCAGTAVSPDRAALPLAAFGASILDIDKDSTVWRFTEPARRGENTWGAKFDVTAELVLIVDYAESPGIEVKQLNISGDITITEPSTVHSLSVADVSALPDDPQRGLREPLSPQLLETISRLTSKALLPEGTEEKIRGLILGATLPSAVENLQRFQDALISPETRARIQRLIAQPGELPPDFFPRFGRILEDLEKIDESEQPEGDSGPDEEGEVQ